MTFNVTLEPFGIAFECGEDETILAAALRQGVGLRYGCKHGGCGTCKAQVAHGDVDVEDASGFALMEFEREAGMALLCTAYPLEDVVIELDNYDEAELTAARPIRELDCRVRGIAALSRDIWRLELEVTDPPFEFDAGQFVEVNVPGTDAWRAYSMANAPADSGEIELLIKHLAGGVFSGVMAGALAPGDRLRVRGPYGQFCVADGFAPIVMVAGGSGMAPILSMLRDLSARSSSREVVFYYGARAYEDLICDEAIAAAAANLGSFSYVPALSEPAGNEAWKGEVGLITEVIERRCDNLRGAEAYLCGPPPMIDAAVEVLKQKGMFGSRIRYDKFVSTAAWSR
ncbi:MAG: NADH:ubiquinone reductase (Na(+)-transporting) subunit F [Gammaproteobacteria bacterium]